MSIYKSQTGKKTILFLYHAQLRRLECPYNDIWLSTSFGKTHLIKTGKGRKHGLRTKRYFQSRTTV